MNPTNQGPSGKQLVGPDAYRTINFDLFDQFLENFVSRQSYFDQLTLLCCFPKLAPRFLELKEYKVDLNHLNLIKFNIQNDQELYWIDHLNTLFPSIKKVSIYTRRFKSDVNNILCTFANFKDLEEFYIVFDSIGKKQFLNTKFGNLKSVTIIFNRSRIVGKLWRKTKYLVKNILHFTTKLETIHLRNVLICEQVSTSLLYNSGLKCIDFMNC